MLLSPFYCGNFKKIFRAHPELWGRTTILGQKLPQPGIILENHWFKFHVPFCPFYCAKLKYNFHMSLAPFQVFRVDPEFWGDTLSLGPKWPIYPNQVFFWKTIKFNLPFSPLFILLNYKKFLQSGSRVMKSNHFRAQNDPFTQNEFFFGKTITLIFMFLLALCHYVKFLKKKQECIDWTGEL